MTPDVRHQAAEYTKAHRRKKRWLKAVTCLASVVVFCTTYALILPAITLGEEQCGIPEHVHTQDCYTQVKTVQEKQLVCTIDPSDFHEHTAECYDEDGNLICGREEKPKHVHTDACYEMAEVPADTDTLTCGKEEGQDHHHTALCYGTWELTCGMQEHTHTKACYADPAVDVESPEIWEKTLEDAPLTGEWRNDLLAVAETQAGYKESQKNYIVLNDGETTRGYTRYGAWDGDPYEEWCASFVSFCLHYADVPEKVFPQDNNCVTWMETLQKKEYDLYQPARTVEEDGTADLYKPAPGNLVFFTWDQNDCADHVGIVTEVIPAKDEEPAKIRTIEGNKSDEVKIQTYAMDSEEILGYGILPEQHFICGKEGHVHTEECYDPDGKLTCEREEHVHTDICEAGQEDQADTDSLTKLTYAGSDYTVRVCYGEDAGLPEGTELKVKEIRKGSDQYKKYLKETEKTLDRELAEKTRFARFFDISFMANGDEVEPEAPVSVSITYDEKIDLSEPGNSQVIHFGEDGPELFDAEARNLKNGSTRFTHTQDRFSIVGDLVTVDVNYNKADAGPDSLPVDYYVCIDGEWTCVGSTKTGWYAPEGATGWENTDRDYITVEQAESILEPYGFDASAENPARKIAYKIKASGTKIYSDTTTYSTDIKEKSTKVIPLSRYPGNPGYDVYYLPENQSAIEKIESPDNLDKVKNAFYTVKVYDAAGKILTSEIVFTGGNFSYTGSGETAVNWLVSYGNGRMETVSRNEFTLTGITSSVTISPKQVDADCVAHSVNYKVMIDGQWQTVGASPYYYSGEVDGKQRSYITSDMAAQFFGDYGFSASEKPGKNIGYSYNDIYTLCYANGTTKTNFCMDVSTGVVKEAQVIQLYTSNGTDAQLFRIWDAGNGYSFITPIESSALHVNVYGYSPTSGQDVSPTQLKLSSATNENSKWKVDTGSDGRTTFWSAISPTDQVIDLNNADMNNGGRLQVWHSTGGARYWYMVQQYRISNQTKVEKIDNNSWKIGLTEESNGDIVCYYLPAEADDWFSSNNKAESDISTSNSFWSVSVRDDTHSVYSDGELSRMTQIVKQNGEVTVTVKNAEGIIWSCVGKNGETLQVEETQSGGYTTFVIKNINQPVEVVATKANPEFTVQYYSNITRFATIGDNPLKVIDTSGKSLPTNGGSMATRNIYLEATDQNTNQNRGDATPLYRVKTVTELTKLYTEGTYEFATSPGLDYFNKLKDNESYTLKEIWVLKDGKEAESTDRSNWDIYSYYNDTSFTNVASEAVGNTILINDGDVIRLVADSSVGSYQNDNTFYDYNISSGQNSDERWRTGITGINSEINYGSSLNGKRNWRSGADVFAFGNANCGTGMSGYLFDEGPLNKWNGNAKNTDGSLKYSGKNDDYGGATFRLASRLNDDGTIRYNDWIVAPKLFNDGDATGKQTYAGSSLTFDRVGDTYTLSSATLNNYSGGSNTLSGLQYFFNPSPYNGKIYTSIFTNNFWPMDTANNPNRVDQNWGEYGNTGKFQGFVEKNDYKWTDLAANFPSGDDGNAHNWFFGMNFAINFNLTSDYEGPLEYYFFGDDDLWVFLDGQLICDIGGVHSSIGEYVNLRDYLPVGSSGQHTLSFFYTERGASGSTCYMSFTLPSVSSKITSQDVGGLQISKSLKNTQSADFSQNEYYFKIELLTGEKGTPLEQVFSYRKSDGTYGTISQTRNTITLKQNETVTIEGIPARTYYRVTESEESKEGYSTTVNGNEGYIVSGTIETGTTKPASFVNTLLTYELPSTGGIGTGMFMIGGLLLITVAGILLIYNQKKRRKEDNTLS